MRHRTRRTLCERLQELRLPAPERAAARSERRAEAAMRSERDNLFTPERRAAAREAERRRYGIVPWI
jgi:hypothetical protein